MRTEIEFNEEFVERIKLETKNTTIRNHGITLGKKDIDDITIDGLVKEYFQSMLMISIM